jgi:hypothetical protein
VIYVPWDWIAGLLTLGAIVQFQRRRTRAGNILGLIAQVPWFMLIWQTRTWGLLPMEVLITGVYAYGVIFWRRY